MQLTSPTSPEEPWPVRTVARKIAEWINRLGSIWVEGQITQISLRPGAATAFLQLRDPSADVSLTLTCSSAMLRKMDPPLTDGSRVVVHGKPTFFVGRGTLSLRVDEIRAVGIGELLARIERLRQLLKAEGLFDPARKRPLPFLPNRVGLVTGRASAAEHDVLTNAQLRWPAVQFEIRNVAVQGSSAVPQILEALQELDAMPEVDVIVLARGGGSVEDLLPFSDEALCRAVSACRTPVVSAIGHEPDSPLVDHVADVRCSTPTGAGKRVVPDVAEETQRIHQLRDRARRALHGWVDRERRLLDALRSRPVLADPHGPLAQRAEQVGVLRDRARRAMTTALNTERHALSATRSRLTTLGPAATLARGYAIVQRIEDGADGVLRSVDDAPPGTRLRVRVVDGAIQAVVPDRAG
ncbi:exodeoxyribonuclease VII large subunit [Saccharopolyspora antimicrobica]|uniref:Exodeoxyribonuclease 7 large subunit n=2 Tax=Saccharopolyspora TaxID=1835 RepID=A0A1I4ZVI4_9PSEU|nr:exodeoxyribonuclease VII large subunit [Saccharopolyspora antimicrobica]SEG78666.1 Exodeoxyribonuclease VII large subunit [Saccharopolyspora kobensis]SFD05930.1 Exodeoxyribonuclease VII large subunit [Saccharopolyspora kobensis]SFN54063.1 exodeoxyribonuclease VII large subunit [Saccharopolyspora antimicrobica]